MTIVNFQSFENNYWKLKIQKSMWQKVVKGSIYLLVFLMPLFWLSFSFEAFEFNKTYLLFLLSAVGLLAWLARMVFEDKKVRFKKGPLDIFILAFLVTMILSTVFSIDKISSLFGFYGRFWPNFIGLISLIIFYFLVTNNVEWKGENAKNNEDSDKKSITIKGIVRVFLWSTVFVVLISYLSLFGVWGKIGQILSLPGIMSFKSFNTIGGSFEQLVIFLSFIFVFLLAFIAFQGNKKNFWLYLLLFSIFLLLILVDFWPSWLVIFLCLLLFLVFSFWKRVFRQDVNRLSLSVLFLIISALFLFTNPLDSFIQQTQVFSDLPQEVNLSQATSWQVGFKGLKEGVVFGSGINTFNYLFAKYKPESFIQGPYWQIRFDRAGNHIAEVIGTSGILGILSYLALIGMFLMICWLVLSSKTNEEIKSQLPLFVAFLGLLISQFVFYQNITLAFEFWLFLALGTVSWRKVQKEKTLNFTDFPEVGLIINIFFWVILLAIGFLFFIMAKSYLADVYYKDYLVNPRDNLVRLEKATRLNDSNASYHIALAGAYLGLVSEELAKSQPDNQTVIGLVALSLNEGRRANEVAPKTIAIQEALGVVYREVQGLAQGALEWSIKTFRAALETEPKNPILLTELGRLLVIDNKKDEAKTLFNKALELRSDYVAAVVQLAALDEEEGKKDEAIKKLEELVAENPFSIDGRFQLGTMYFNQQYYTKAIEQFQSILTIFPNHSNSLYSLGLIYEARGSKATALDYFNKVLELNPGNELIENKIAQLQAEPEETEE